LSQFANSILISFFIVLGQLAFCVPGAYAFAHLRLPWKNGVFLIFVVLMLLPPQASLVSNFIVLMRMNLLDTYSAVILPGMFSAFALCIMRAYMKTIPTSCFEAAEIDGAGSFRVFWSIALPQAKGGMASLVVLGFIDAWNMIEQPLVLIRDAAKYPLSVTLGNTGASGLAFVFGVLFMIPPLLVFLHYRDDFLRGIQI